jgi:hypothetical protein
VFHFRLYGGGAFAELLLLVCSPLTAYAMLPSRFPLGDSFFSLIYPMERAVVISALFGWRMG